MPPDADQRVSTGLPSLDALLDGLRIGDNVVWRVEHIDDYRRFIAPFVAAATEARRSLIYLRFAHHPPLIEPNPWVKIVSIDAEHGFESLTRQVYRLITDHGRGAFYLFDCLSDLLGAWATDRMVGNFFRVVCPYLFELDTVAYFALLRHEHSLATLQRIRQTTQVLLDVHRDGPDRYVQPVKVWRRASPTMFLPHAIRGERFDPVADSARATRLRSTLDRRDADESRRRLDYWDRLFLRAAEAAEGRATPAESAQVLDRLCRAVLGRDERILELARRHFSLADLLEIRGRMIGSGYIGGKAAGMLLSLSLSAVMFRRLPSIAVKRKVR